MPAGIPYRVRRSERARHARIVVDADGVEVVVPRRMALRAVEPFVAEKGPWIERTLRRLADAEREQPRATLVHGGGVPFMGEWLALNVGVEPGRARARVVRSGDALTVRLPADDQDALRDALERRYRRLARGRSRRGSTRPASAPAGATRRSRSAVSARAGRVAPPAGR